VYVVAHSRAITRPVRILFDDSKNMAVAGELQPADEVIVEGQLRVVPGGLVRVMPPNGRPHDAAGQQG
jgi:hypothetical protein